MLRFTVRSHPGCIRDKNEDCYFIPPEKGPFIFAVADGMGGHAAGEVASSLSIEALEKNIARFSDKLQSYSLNEMKNFLKESILKANKEIFDIQSQSSDLKGMGTTFTVAVFFHQELLIGHIGDSQAYLFNESGYVQITEDHSLVAELLKNGEIEPDEVYDHPQRHLLTRALGTSSSLNIDFYTEGIKPGDCILLCTDGLTNVLRPAEIRDIIFEYDYRESNNLEKVADRLLNKANELGGPDNITFELICYDKF
ncbi:MAG TPA: Stp1/IreP family PP2C-type Ser/Thr phosphatase [Firmicutes bacterium]|jgi:serine/threonine protein phosphatase PrpC|nr:Stp1/IreP family PP2C-type Ser/Thr phosphatase [Bacillota bacterium]